MDESDDRRHAKRVRTILGARVVFNGGLSSVECQVRDLSDTGAKLIAENTMYIPDEFQLEVSRKGLSRKATVRWRDRDAVGVAFESNHIAPEVDLPTRIRELEAENALLRRRLAEMAMRLDSYGDSERSAI